MSGGHVLAEDASLLLLHRIEKILKKLESAFGRYSQRQHGIEALNASAEF